MEILDCIGIPEYFATVIGKVESAGGGCVRIYACAEHGGVLVPIYCTVMPALKMVAATRQVQEAVRELFKAREAVH